ncbi:MAG: hypothetical protein K5867_01785 [Bacteroidales bacterium]|nr:hypothetical protein [Bacteroidales bacterium]
MKKNILLSSAIVAVLCFLGMSDLNAQEDFTEVKEYCGIKDNYKPNCSYGRGVGESQDRQTSRVWARANALGELKEEIKPLVRKYVEDINNSLRIEDILGESVLNDMCENFLHENYGKHHIVSCKKNNTEEVHYVFSYTNSVNKCHILMNKLVIEYLDGRAAWEEQQVDTIKNSFRYFLAKDTPVCEKTEAYKNSDGNNVYRTSCLIEQDKNQLKDLILSWIREKYKVVSREW